MRIRTLALLAILASTHFVASGSAAPVEPLTPQNQMTIPYGESKVIKETGSPKPWKRYAVQDLIRAGYENHTEGLRPNAGRHQAYRDQMLNGKLVVIQNSYPWVGKMGRAIQNGNWVMRTGFCEPLDFAYCDPTPLYERYTVKMGKNGPELWRFAQYRPRYHVTCGNPMDESPWVVEEYMGPAATVEKTVQAPPQQGSETIVHQRQSQSVQIFLYVDAPKPVIPAAPPVYVTALGNGAISTNGMQMQTWDTGGGFLAWFDRGSNCYKPPKPGGPPDDPEPPGPKPGGPPADPLVPPSQPPVTTPPNAWEHYDSAINPTMGSGGQVDANRRRGG